MRTIKILILWLISGLIVGFLIWYLPSKLRSQYTARTFVRVLPGSEKGSVIALIKHQNTLEAVVDRDKVQWTEWFQSFGKTKDDRMAGAVADLKKRSKSWAVPDNDLVAVSMTCRDGKDAAEVLNEMVNLFVRSQESSKRKEVADKLSRLSEQQLRVQRDLDLSEQDLDNVRRRYGYADLDEHSYPDPRISRLMDLQKREDSCVLEIRELQFYLEDINTQPTSTDKAEVKPNAEVKELGAKLRMLQSRFKELQTMREEAEKQYKELNLAKAQYAQRKAIRDERRQMLDSIKSRLEELKILYDDPDASGVQFVEDAVVPRQADMRPWQGVIPPVVLAALIAGIIQALLTRQARKTKPE